jgi:hypothetical protein
VSGQILELDTMGQEGTAIQTALAQKLNKSRVTVPQVFIDGKPIGGCSDLQAAQANGTLDEMLEALKKTGESGKRPHLPLSQRACVDGRCNASSCCVVAEWSTHVALDQLLRADHSCPSPTAPLH